MAASSTPGPSTLAPSRERLLLWLVVAVGIAVSVLAYAVLARQLEATHRLDFEWTAHNRARAIQQQIGGELQAIETLASVLSVAQTVDEAQLSLLARSAMEGSHGIRALALLPPTGERGGAPSVQQVEPPAGRWSLSGLDPGRVPALRDLLAEASARSSVVLSGPPPAEEAAWDACSVLAACSYSRGAVGEGHVLALIDISELAHGAISMLEPRGVEVVVRDVTDGDERFLASYASRLTPSADRPCVEAMNGAELERSATATIPVAGRTWSVITSPTGRFRSAEAFDEGPLVVLLGGLLITLLLTLALSRAFQARSLQAQAIRSAHLASLGVLAAGAAHEINNPNNAIGFNASVLARVLQDAIPVLQRRFELEGDFRVGGLSFSEARDSLPRLAEEIVSSSRRIKRITANMKHLGRADDGDLTQRIDLRRALDAAVTILRNRIDKGTSRFEIDVPDGLPAVRGNSQQIEQVLINLLLNAVQALPERDRGVRVTARTSDQERRVEIRIEDEGVGIASTIRDRITEPFFTTREGSGGMGLGLAICTSIVESHQGALTFRAGATGGTLVTVVLPVATPEEDPK
jgi:signal transduction histidine kinase